MKRATTILIRIIGILFIATGLSKLAHLDPMSAEMFEKAHFPSWLLYVAAVFELIGGILLLMAKTRKTGAVLVACVMMGAIGTHVILKDNPAHAIVPVLIMLFAGYVVVRNK